MTMFSKTNQGSCRNFKAVSLIHIKNTYVHLNVLFLENGYLRIFNNFKAEYVPSKQKGNLSNPS